ncbi:MAG: WD40 repeat domain-containing protein [Phycisphaerae bacterium]|nr:WD40 repeat domain-containing protein [Phycisphaerae bacterium]
MFESHWIKNLFLTAGGSTPALYSVGADSQMEAEEDRCPLPASAYAIDLNPIQGILACGTRDGTIHVFSASRDGDGQEPPQPTRILAGRAVTSLCFGANGSLISADESGRVLHWRAEDNDASRPARWSLGGEAIYLLGSTGEHVIGVGDEGQVLIWREGDGLIEARLAAPAPARPIALARPTTWALHDGAVVAYPARNGQLVVIRADPPSIYVTTAHEGPWYAAFQVDEHLATLGHDDGLIRFWHLAPSRPECIDERPAFHSAMDAEVFGAGSAQGVAVLSDGRAVRFAISQDSFTLLHAIPGKGFRAVVGASASAQRAFEMEQRRLRANELQDWIATSIDSEGDTDLHGAFDELDSLGAEDVSLALKAHQAMRAGDLLLELELRHRLVRLLPLDSPDAQPSHERYIALLFEFGQYELALEAIDQSTQATTGGATGNCPPWLHATTKAMNAGREVVFSGPDRAVPVDQMIAAAQLLGRPLAGLWELHRSGRAWIPDAVVQSAHLASAIEYCNHDTFGFDVRTCASRVLWVESGDAQPIEAVVVSPYWDKPCEHFKVLLRTTPAAGGTEITRSILLAGGAVQSDHEGLVCGSRLLEKMAMLREKGGRAAFLAPVNKLLRRTLQGLRGAAAAHNSFSFGGAL